MSQFQMNANYAPNDPNVFGVIMRHADGSMNHWEIVGPRNVMDEQWIRSAVMAIMTRMERDLLYGHSMPEVRPNRNAFYTMPRGRVLQELDAMIRAWDKHRIESARATAKPIPTMGREQLDGYHP